MTRPGGRCGGSCCRPWRESGLAAPADIDALNQKISQLEQQVIDLRLQLEEQGDDLTAARAANRELMAQLNTMSNTGDTPRRTLDHTCCGR